MKSSVIVTLAITAVLCSVALASNTPYKQQLTALDEYVRKADPSYKYEEITTARIVEPRFTIFVLNMTSQTWMTEKESSRPVWWHYLAVVVPAEVVSPQHSFMYITGGSNHDGPPDFSDSELMFVATVASSTGTVTALLQQIPNEPIVFPDDPSQQSRSEDAIIAWTWKHFLANSSDPTWLARLPMTKAVVRAMDTIQDFTSKRFPNIDVQHFCIAGASKRGWTTWTVGAADPVPGRIIAIVPIVMDLLNMVKNLHHVWQAYGGWTFAFADYYKINLTGNLDNPNMQLLADIVDPYSYIDRLEMPKYIVSTSGDEFFLPDDNYFFFDQLKGEKYLRVTEDAEHSLAGHEIFALYEIEAFYLSIIQNYARPKFNWTIDEGTGDLHIDVDAANPPLKVKLWHAATLSSKRRDFRLLALTAEGKISIQPIFWIADELEPIHTTATTISYLGQKDAPKLGWRGFFAELEFKGPGPSTMVFTTQVSIVPQEYPFPPCYGEACYGTLI